MNAQAMLEIEDLVLSCLRRIGKQGLDIEVQGRRVMRMQSDALRRDSE